MSDKKPTYYELLLHPMWQRKRLKLLEAAEFRCTHCGSDNKTLHIHHTYYEKCFKPWDYPDETLRVLCAPCHEDAQDKMARLKRQIGKTDSLDLERLYGYALGLETVEHGNALIDVTSYECAEGVGHAWGLSADRVIEALRECKIDGFKLYELKNGKRLDVAE